MALSSTLPEILRRDEAAILAEWLENLAASGGARNVAIKEGELRRQATEFLSGFQRAVQATSTDEINTPEWAGVRDVIVSLSAARARQGFSPSETALFVLSLKQPLFRRLQIEHASSQENLMADLWRTTQILDRLALFTVETYQRAREEVIARQQQELLELSTPVVQLWDGVLALPLIGTLDSERTQIVMESLLQEIVNKGAAIAIIDITGVPTVDTLVAQHLLKTVAAARLMGADCIISGIRPQIAQTIVHLGVELNDVTTKSSLADAFSIALRQLGLMVTRSGQPSEIAR